MGDTCSRSHLLVEHARQEARDRRRQRAAQRYITSVLLKLSGGPPTLLLGCAQQTKADPALPLRVGMGLDAGEAVPLEGGYRGGALNLTARLCSLVGPTLCWL